MYKQVKKALKKNGELMVKVSDGQTFELHLHNVTFDDTSKLIVIEGGKETYWVNGDEIVYMWIHREVK